MADYSDLPEGFGVAKPSSDIPAGFSVVTPRAASPFRDAMSKYFVPLGAAETGAQMLTGMVASPINHFTAAAAEAIPGGRNAADVMTNPPVGTYEPRSQIGQKMSGALSTVTAPIAAVADFVANPTDNPEYTVGEHVVKGAYSFLPFMGRASRATPKTAPPVNLAVQQARNQGYTLQPSQVLDGKPIGSFSERLFERGGGKASVPAEASLRNQTVTNRLVASDLGLKPGESITPATLGRLRDAANVAYKDLQSYNVPLNLAADQQYLAGLQQVRQSTVSALRGNKPDPRIDELVTDLSKPQGVVNVRSVMDEVRQLRADSRKNYLSDDPATAKLGAAQRQVADVLEESLERAMAPYDPRAVDRYRAARVRLAQIHTVEDALKGSDVDARVLAQARKSGTPLTGGMAAVADAADYFPQVLQTNSRLGSTSGAGLLDVAMSVPTLGLWAVGREGAKQAALRAGRGTTGRPGPPLGRFSRLSIPAANAFAVDENGRPIIPPLRP